MMCALEFFPSPGRPTKQTIASEVAFVVSLGFMGSGPVGPPTLPTERAWLERYDFVND